jgi:hypothetical protein
VTGGSDLLESTERSAAAAGFNLVAVVDVEAFDAAAPPEHGIRRVLDDPELRSVIVIGSGGTTFWEIFKGRRPGARLEELEAAGGSIDAYSRLVIPRLAAGLEEAGARAHVLYSFDGSGRQMSFRRLAEFAGFGTTDTVLTMLIHPTYGPWVSIRGALATDAALPTGGPLQDFRPCEGCPRPCVAACPIGTFDGPAWDWDSCLRYRVLEDGCPTACLSRRACVVGVAHQYSEEEYSYRHAFFPERLAQLRAQFAGEGG